MSNGDTLPFTADSCLSGTGLEGAFLKISNMISP
ncbi:uncharacterized protein G2W53_031478 [Senna tora]|uniref:Uncharacterized protein n=1 Tax=Senna tora TaxID=362788 RepID=A0A834T8P9_9FABA|nr:uncharacterized protein G2W53_031478 [Senna tora]